MVGAGGRGDDVLFCSGKGVWRFLNRGDGWSTLWVRDLLGLIGQVLARPASTRLSLWPPSGKEEAQIIRFAQDLREGLVQVSMVLTGEKGGNHESDVGAS